MKGALDTHIAEEMWGKQIVFDSHLTGVAGRLEGWLVLSNGMWQELWERLGEVIFYVWFRARDDDLLFRNILKSALVFRSRRSICKLWNYLIWAQQSDFSKSFNAWFLLNAPDIKISSPCFCANWLNLLKTSFLLIKHSFSSFRDNFERGVAPKNYWHVEIYTLDKVNEHDMVQGFFPNNNKHVRDNKTTSSVGVTVWQFIDWQVIIKRDPPTLIKKKYNHKLLTKVTKLQHMKTRKATIQEIIKRERWEGTEKSSELVTRLRREPRLIESQGCGLEHIEQWTEVRH